MKPFKVINWNFNMDNIEHYDIMPYLEQCYNELEVKPTSFEDVKQFILRESQYQFWSRCQYEVIVTGWPQQKREYKLDVYEQIEMNIDVITNHFISQLCQN